MLFTFYFSLQVLPWHFFLLRRHGKVAIDTLTFKFDVMRVEPEQVEEGPDDGIYCHGLWLEGAKHDGAPFAAHIKMRPHSAGRLPDVCHTLRNA